MPERDRDGDVTVRRVWRGAASVRVTSIDAPGDRPFVLLAGIGVASTCFERLAPALSTVGPVHALDLPGFGGVRSQGSRPGIDDFADLVEAVIDDLGCDDPILLGPSMGTQVVTEVAARRPGIRDVVLIGPVVDASDRCLLPQAWRLLRCVPREPGAISAHVIGSYLMCDPRRVVRVLRHMLTYPIEQRCRRVRADTLLIRGEHDATCPRDWCEELARLTPHARCWEIPGGAHSVMYAHADEVARLCIEHVRRPTPTPEEARRHEFPGDGRRDRTPRRSPRQVLAELRGSWRVVRGMVTGNDALMARGYRVQGRVDDNPAPEPIVERSGSSPSVRTARSDSGSHTSVVGADAGRPNPMALAHSGPGHRTLPASPAATREDGCRVDDRDDGHVGARCAEGVVRGRWPCHRRRRALFDRGRPQHRRRRGAAPRGQPL